MSPKELNLPWKPRSRQMDGLASEAQIAKARGARVHPRSGAGKIKWDASDEETLYEMKDANKTHQLSGELLKRLHLAAIQQGKTAEYVIYFTDANLTATIRIESGKK